MVDKISGYKIEEKIYEGSRTVVYKGFDEEKKRPVILKCLKNDYPLPEEIAYFKREYEILRNLDIDGVIKTYGLKKWGSGFVIILENFPGESMRSILSKRKLDLTEFLSFGIKAAETIGEIQKHSIIHKDINPGNILYNHKTKKIRIIDFGIASMLAQENPGAGHPNVLEGTLAYISPEQTGRMNRPIDYRSDFYSLGVMFYEILTGNLPFEGDDAMELVHCHLARNPVPPHEKDNKIPVVISNIIMKLMGKMAEDRYQSVFGLISDLKRSREQMDAGRVVKEFDIGKDDVSAQFLIPGKLYGREKEIATLINTFDHVSNRTAELLLVTGYAGIGKSALVYQIYKPITEKHGYFTTGKFDLLKRNIPYYSLIQVFQEFVKQLLTESEENIHSCKKELVRALGRSGQIIIDVIPEVELIIGKQPPVPELPPQESQNRFNLVFQDFVRAFASEDHPLAIFLDDLQWADSASLNLLELFLTDFETKNILFIGAYRDNEVDDVHPLALMLQRSKEAWAVVHTISLQPLHITDINRLISETLKCDLTISKPLAELCLQKTGGNPFFLKELLVFLYKEGLIAFDDKRGEWQWDTGEIEKIGITDNVVELLTGRIQKMPKNTQKVLKLAAFIGSRFDLHTLSIACYKSREETLNCLWGAMQEQLILPLDDSYKLVLADQTDSDGGEVGQTGSGRAAQTSFKFSHDRIQHAAYILIPEYERAGIHLEVGQLMLQSIPFNRREEKIFEILYQLNFGIDEITRQSQRDELAGLNLMGGRKAKASAAYPQALKYLQQGLKLLKEDSWQRQYELTLALHVECAEAAYLNGNYKQMEQLAQVVMGKTRTLAEKVKIYEIIIQALLAQNKLPEAIQVGLKVLKFFGERFPEKPGRLNVLSGFIKTKMALTRRSTEDLIRLPEMTDTSLLLLMRILTKIASSAYLGDPELFALTVFKQIDLSLKHGNSYMSCYSYGQYAVMLCGTGAIEPGYNFGQLVLRLMQRFDAKELKARIMIVYAMFIKPWKEPLRDTLKMFMDNYQSALELGDLEFASWSLLFHSTHSLYMGRELTVLDQEMTSHIDAISKIKQERALLYLKLFHRTVLDLIGKTRNSGEYTGKSLSGKIIPPPRVEKNDRSANFVLYLNRLTVSYLFQEYPGAFENAVNTRKYLASVKPLINYPVFYFYDSLSHLAVYSGASKSRQKNILKTVAKNQKRMKKWADHAPMNFMKKYYLVEAEQCRVLGRDIHAMDFYDRSIQLAKEHEFLNIEALANELAAKFYLSINREKIARLYMKEAHYCYTRWGAAAKVKDMEEKYRHLIKPMEEDKKIGIKTKEPSTPGDSVSIEFLDLTTIMKASQTISEEIVLSQLLKKMMKIVIENAGAQKGFLILETDGTLRVEAEGFSDRENVEILQSIPVEEKDDLSLEIIQYAARTKESVVLNDALHEGRFATTPYILTHKPKSILCSPLIYQDRLIGILYLENNMTTHAFTRDRIEILKILTSQAAISIENALLFDNLEASKEEYRTLFENLNVGVYRTAGELPARFLKANPAFIKIFGYNSVEDFLKTSAEGLYLNPEALKTIFEAISEQGWVKNMELPLKRKDGASIWALINAKAQREKNGNIKWIDGIVEDITERKLAEEELQKHREHLEELVKERTFELKSKNEEIISSIDYAKRIQLSILPTEEKIRPFINNHFVIWRPREVVGGDFYWFHSFPDAVNESKRENFLMAVVDCTGHGVPGAFMTMTANSVLNRIVGDICDNDPAKILQELNRIIRATLNQDTLISLSDDGMDIGLCYVKPGEKKLIYAGAKISLFYNTRQDIVEIKGNRQSIGYKRSKEDYEYINHEIKLKGSEVFYLTTDGYLHQNGEESEKKFGKKRFKEMIREIHKKSLSRQKEIIKNTLMKYMGKETQRDDITVIGFQP